MRNPIKAALIGALAISALWAAPVSAGGQACDGGTSGPLDAFGLTQNGRLICFEVDSPTNIDVIGQVSGLMDDSSLLGIDYRAANGLLYGLGDLGGIYTIDTSDASATKVSQLTIMPMGSSFGVDINPAADALRVISDDGQNLRHVFSTDTTTMDGTLNYVGPPPISPATGVTGAGYTNNDGDTNTGTLLYDIDTNLDQLVVQASANSGTLNAVGKLGLDADLTVGFDIYSVLSEGTSIRGRGFAVLAVGGDESLYRINLNNGVARFRGSFGPNVVDIALPLAQG